ncbi:MAG: GNAT family N-acetyltransferase [Pseudomonadales bacterium]
MDGLRRYLARPDHLMFVAIADGCVIGQVLAVVRYHPDKPTELYVDDLGVAPEHQRRGIATRLMRAAVARSS